jgi:hypothetical protein
VPVPVVTTVAMIMKVALFIFVYWLLYAGRMVFYMAKIHELNQNVDQEWAAFRSSISFGK